MQLCSILDQANQSLVLIAYSIGILQWNPVPICIYYTITQKTSKFEVSFNLELLLDFSYCQLTSWCVS
jgi:hypothetical protein